MSDNNEQVAPELKAGHPPAMKVGGMRVPLPKHVHEEKPEPAPAKEGEEEAVAADPAVKEKQGGNRTVVISGAHVKEKDIYSPEAARAIHEKPQPTHSHTAGHQPGHTHNMSNLMQPRKNY